ncbi:hypothetical protein SeMB42_g03806 [Synchytrium endobioticum]|uniref:Uncharacterized protein n=1 Tax=Synchytrium endobioticum TaxID=286115 RepID=A0A507D4H2_9FUNG|nr:hypothetical protein SeMB42_g03806 [Synchytrium endobioticum]
MTVGSSIRRPTAGELIISCGCCYWRTFCFLCSCRSGHGRLLTYPGGCGARRKNHIKGSDNVMAVLINVESKLKYKIRRKQYAAIFEDIESKSDVDYLV